MLELNTYNISQLLSLVAILFYLVTFQFKKRSQILLCLSGSALFNACHFIVLGSYTAGALALISMIRSLTAYFSTNKTFIYLFVSISIGVFYLTVNNTIQFLPLTASIMATWASFQEKDRTIRIIFMITTTLWLIHNIYILTVGGIFLESLFLISNVIGYIRFYKKEKFIT